MTGHTGNKIDLSGTGKGSQHGKTTMGQTFLKQNLIEN